MKFSKEIDLVKVLKESLICKYQRHSNIEIFEEVCLGFGIADVVVTNLGYIQNFSSNSRSEALNSFDINIYVTIGKWKDGISFAKIVDVTRGNKKKVLQSIDKLVMLNYIYNIDGSYLIIEEYKFCF